MRHDKPIFPPKDFKQNILINVIKGIGNLEHKKQLIKNWQKSIVTKKINTAKEEELQADFLYSFFGEILEYSYQQHEPNTQLRLEVKTKKDQTKADGALGYFVYDAQTETLESDVRVVIELKEPYTDLDKKQNRKDFKGSPVEQAFTYANKFDGKSEWIIVSDFVEIRLYHISNSDKYELFKITELFEDLNLAKFFFIFHKDRLFLQNQDSPIKMLFNEKRAEEIKISNEFYNGYRDNRETLFFNILRKNPTENPFELLSATQKLMDRLVFICFVRDAIPMIDVLADARKILLLRHSKKDTKLWEAVQETFVSFDEGYVPNIPQFNGGLFKPDALIDRLVIKDDILLPVIDFLLLYDFQSQLNVSILGHIFEQSIADLEELRGEIAKLLTPAPPLSGGDFATSSMSFAPLPEGRCDVSQGQGLEDHISTIHNNISKRKKDGIFYTPDYVTKYMLQQTIGEWLEEKKQALLQKYETENADFWADYETVLKSITVLDPACGSGAFLTAVFDYLWAEWKIVINAGIKLGTKKELYRKEEWQLKKAIVLNNIFGVDLNMESVEITKLALWLQTASAYEPLSDLSGNVKRGNSLIDDRTITEWAFDWQKEFPQVFAKQGFDVVVGNPPYVNIELIDDKSRKFLLENYVTCKGRTDLYVAFIEQAQKLVAKNGAVSFIIPYAFTNQNYAEIARKQLVEATFIREITDFSSFYIFEDAIVKNIVLRFENKISQKLTTISKANSQQEITEKKFTSFQIPQTDFLKLKENRFETKNIYQILDLRDKICKNTVSLDKICFVAYGARLNEKDSQNGKEKYIHQEKQKGFKPFLEGKNIDRYHFSQFGWLDYKPKEHYNSMFPELFENEKIMFLRVVKDKLRFAYDNKNFYNSHTVINCVRYDKLQNVDYVSVKSALKEIDIDFAKNYEYIFLLALLNSHLITWYFNNFLSDGINFYPNDAKNLPIIRVSAKNQEPIIQKAMLMQQLKNDFYAFGENVLDVFKSDFQNKKISTKLNLWYEMTFEEFASEIVKCGGKVSSKQKFDYIPLFKEQKEKAMNMVNLITQTDQEIDNLVYELYELSAEEIEMIEKL